MNEDSVPATDIIEEHGSFLLIRAGSRFAVVERRGGQIYPMMPGKREGEPLTSEGMASVIAQEGSLPEDEARRLFAELCARGDRLAQTDVVAEPASDGSERDCFESLAMTESALSLRGAQRRGNLVAMGCTRNHRPIQTASGRAPQAPRPTLRESAGRRPACVLARRNISARLSVCSARAAAH